MLLEPSYALTDLTSLLSEEILEAILKYYEAYDIVDQPHGEVDF